MKDICKKNNVNVDVVQSREDESYTSVYLLSTEWRNGLDISCQDYRARADSFTMPSSKQIATMTKNFEVVVKAIASQYRIKKPHLKPERVLNLEFNA